MIQKRLTLEDITAKETEQALLSHVANTPELFDSICQDLDPIDFFYPENKALLMSLQSLSEDGKVASAVNCIEEMKRQEGKLLNVGDVFAIFNIPHVGIDYYESIATLKQKTALRNAMECLEGILSNIESKTTVEELRERIDKELERISASCAIGKGVRSMREIATDLEKTLREEKESKFSLPGLSTGLYDLDQLIKGLQKGHLIILGARPGTGKTTLALNLASQIAGNDNSAVGFISLEMTDQELAIRLASASSGLSLSILQKKDWDGEQGKVLFSSIEELKELGAYIDDSVKASLSSILAKASFMKRRHKIKALFVDYLQLMRLSDQHSGAFTNRVYEVSEITRSLKMLAKKLEIPVVCLSQLSREVEKRGGDGRPQLADLKDSGSIEQDADIVIFIKKHEEEEGRGSEIIVAKNRHGECGIVKVEFNKELCRFEEV